jgi:hypothetical protein
VDAEPFNRRANNDALMSPLQASEAF